MKNRTLPPGVYAMRDGRFRAMASLGGEDMHVGYYDSVERAVSARVAAIARWRQEHSGPRDSCRELLSDWLNDREAESGDGNDRSRAKHIFAAAWVDRPPRLVKNADIREWMLTLERTNATPPPNATWKPRRLGYQTRKHALNLARKFFGDMGKHYRGQNPCEGVSPGKKDSAPKSRAYLTMREIERLLSLDLPTRIRAIYTTAIYTGMRAGELWALRWNDVHWEPWPHIEVTKSHRKGTKTGEERVVPMLPIVAAILKSWQRESAAIGSKLVFPCGVKGIGRGWVGWHQCAKGYCAEWDTWARKHAKIVLAFEQCRHTCGSHLVMGTWGPPQTLEYVAKWLGHKDIRTTQKHYAHLSPEATRRTLDQLTATWDPNQHVSGPTEKPTVNLVTLADANGFEPLTFGSGGAGKKRTVSRSKR